MTYEVVSTQEITVVTEAAKKVILAVRVSYTEGDFFNETTFELPGDTTDELINQKIIEYGVALKDQISERNFDRTGTI